MWKVPAVLQAFLFPALDVHGKKSKFSHDAAADAFMYSALSSSTNGSLNGRRGGSRLGKPISKIWLREVRQGGGALHLHAAC